MQHVVINVKSLILLDVLLGMVVNAEQVVSEGRDHEELLEHRVHVADAPQVPQTHVLL
jgi:hypothetical protein